MTFIKADCKPNKGVREEIFERFHALRWFSKMMKFGAIIKRYLSIGERRSREFYTQFHEKRQGFFSKFAQKRCHDWEKYLKLYDSEILMKRRIDLGAFVLEFKIGKTHIEFSIPKYRWRLNGIHKIFEDDKVAIYNDERTKIFVLGSKAFIILGALKEEIDDRQVYLFRDDFDINVVDYLYENAETIKDGILKEWLRA